MPVQRITVTAVSDEGDLIIVWGRPEHDSDDGEPVGFAFTAKGDPSGVELAERASRLALGTHVVIDYVPVVGGWNLARGLAVS